MMMAMVMMTVVAVVPGFGRGDNARGQDGAQS